ncbi:nickel ABC transporter substrate-binding protein [Paenibacillus odorifer]|uniref:nickel ABC transporter substrate-binding protein n=1 Tax=Paenibacillus odorifer TaxID=189426 RepID=UPI00289E34B2|nr:nickel ABC transporter substrate-binding protein [Paenibacillus odorifer]
MFVKKRSKKIVSITMILSLILILSGCGQQKDNSNPSATAQPQGTVSEKNITVSWMRDLGDNNPHAYYPSQLFAQSMLYEPLVSYSEGGEIKPFLAESWTISEDGKEYVFKLRSDVKFSDGTPFNAAIVKKNFDSILLNKSTHSWLGVVKVMEKTEVLDDYTFKLTLSKAYYPTLQDLSTVRPFRFLAEAGFPDDGDTLKSIKAAIGTGPWILSDYKQDQYAVFTKNPNYWGEQPKLDKVTVKIIPDAETRVLAFEKGELDMIFGEGAISLDTFKQLQDSGKYETDVSQAVGTRNLVLNSSNEKLADLNVRLALQHGIDKATLVNGVTAGVEEKADQVLTKDYPYVDTVFESIDYDVEKAKGYLDEAGWKLSEGGAVREKDGQKLEIEIMYDTTDRIQKVMGEVIQASWAEIGVQLKLVPLELKEQTKRFREGHYDVQFWFNSGVPYDPHTLINAVAEPSFGIAEAHASLTMKPELDKQIVEALASTDEGKRKELYSSILKTVQEQSVIIPLSYIKQTVVYQKNLENVTFPVSRWDHPFDSIDLVK